MPTKRTSKKKHIEYHKDGSVWAKGQTANGAPVGYWEWFRLDGTRMRSGQFENGEQIGEWTTYDKKGQVYKVTNIKPKKKDAYHALQRTRRSRSGCNRTPSWPGR